MNTLNLVNSLEENVCTVHGSCTLGHLFLSSFQHLFPGQVHAGSIHQAFLPVSITISPILLSQVLGVRQGHLDLHGCPRNVTWTRLAETALANATSLTLQQEVDWVAGDRIVVAPTGKNGNETEASSNAAHPTAMVTDSPLHYRSVRLRV